VADAVVELGEDHVGSVDLVAGGGEVPDWAEVGARSMQYLRSLEACGWSV